MKENVSQNVRILNLYRMEFAKAVIFLIKNVQNATKADVKIVKKDSIQKETPVNNVLQFLRIVHFAVPPNALLVKMEKSYKKTSALKSVKKIISLKKESAEIVMKHFQIVRNALSWSAQNAVRIIYC